MIFPYFIHIHACISDKHMLQYKCFTLLIFIPFTIPISKKEAKAYEWLISVPDDSIHGYRAGGIPDGY